MKQRDSGLIVPEVGGLVVPAHIADETEAEPQPAPVEAGPNRVQRRKMLAGYANNVRKEKAKSRKPKAKVRCQSRG